MHDNSGAHKCKLVKNFLETETVVQLPNSPYSPDWSACDISLLTLLKSNLYSRRYEPQGLLVVPLFNVYRVCPNTSTYLLSEP